MRTPIRAALVAAALALVISGCSSDGSDDTATDSGSSSVTADDLDGTTYSSTSVTGQDLVEGTVVALAFEDGNLSVSAGCNGQSAAYEVDGGTVKWTGPAAATTMACSDELMAQDQWLGEMFTAGATATLDGDTLTITDGDVTMELSDAG